MFLNCGQEIQYLSDRPRWGRSAQVSHLITLAPILRGNESPPFVTVRKNVFPCLASGIVPRVGKERTLVPLLDAAESPSRFQSVLQELAFCEPSGRIDLHPIRTRRLADSTAARQNSLNRGDVDRCWNTDVGSNGVAARRENLQGVKDPADA